MYIALCRMYFDLYDSSSLKDKRNIVRSIKQRLRGEFNIAIAEVDAQDSATKAILAAVSVANDPQFLNGRMQALVNMVERIEPGLLSDYQLIVEFADPDEE